MTATTNIYSALVAAQTSAAAVGKDAKNSHQGYKYASSEAIITEARVALNSAGLAVYRVASSVEWEPATVVESRNGPKTIRIGKVLCTYNLAHVGGETLVLHSETPCVTEAGRPEDKAVATALTYSLGYFLRDLLLLPRVEEGHEVDQRDDRQYAPPPPVDYNAIAAAFAARIMGAESDAEIKAVGKDAAAAKLPPALFTSLKTAADARRASLASKREPGEEG